MTSYYDQVLEASYLHTRPNCYFVGPYARLVSFASQQHRAVDLVSALHQQGRLTHKRIAIVGAGVAGVTAAAMLHALGHKLDLYEAHSDAIQRQRHASHRIVHPSISRWPFEKLEYTTTFGFMDWAIGSCDSVIKALTDQWDKFLKPGKHDTGIRFFPLHHLRDILCVDGRISFDIEEAPPDPGKPEIYDLAIITIGFGNEAAVADLTCYPYWTPDEIDGWRRAKNKVLVSGCGDGGLIDALRLVHGNFEDGRLVLKLAHILDSHPEIKSSIERIEADALLAAKSAKCMTDSVDAEDQQENHRQLDAFYMSLAANLPHDAQELLSASYQAAGMPRNHVYLISGQKYPIGPYTAPIHKLMIAHASREFYIKYLRARLNDSGKVESRSDPDLARKINATKTLKVVVRHGPTSNVDMLNDKEKQSLRIRQFLLADYIDKKNNEEKFPKPTETSGYGTFEYAGVRHAMANKLVEWMQKGAFLTVRDNKFFLSGADLAGSGLGRPTSLFGLQVESAPSPSATFF